MDAEGYGLTFPRGVEDDDKWHSVKTTDGKRGCYRYTSNGKPRGLFRRWSDEPVSWVCPPEVWEAIKREERRSQGEYLAGLEEARRQKDGDDARLAESRARAAVTAGEVWAKAKPATTHPYLSAKGVKAYGLRVTAEGELLVPLLSEIGRAHV